TTTECAPPPPACAAGQYPVWVPAEPVLENGVETGGTTTPQWLCTGPCDLLIQFGGMFGNRLVCAPKPDCMLCATGDTETFDLNSESWQCQTSCTGGTYDPADYNG